MLRTVGKSVFWIAVEPRVFNFVNAMKSPPGPRDGLMGLGLARQFSLRPLQFLSGLVRDYGDLAYFRLGPFHACLVNHPELIHEVLVKQRASFPKLKRHSRVVRSFSGNSVFVAEGQAWLRQRRFVQPAFHARRIEGYVQAAIEQTKHMLRDWKPDSEIDLVQAMSRLVMTSIAKALFRVDLTDRADEISKALRIHSETLRDEFRAAIVLPDFFPTPAKRRKRWAVNCLDEWVRWMIRERRASGRDDGDVLSMLLATTNEQEDSQAMTDQQICDEARVLFLAGQDDTTAALSWCFFLLAQHSDIEARLRQEIASVVGIREPVYSDVARLTYTEMVIKETLRLYPPTWSLVPRVAAQDVELGGNRIRHGTWVIVSPYATHHDLRFFSEPEQFDPDRFSPTRQSQIPPFAYIPFGGGPRACVGNTYSLNTMVAMVAMIAQQFRMAIVDDPRTIVPDPSLALRPKGGLRVRLQWV